MIPQRARTAAVAVVLFSAIAVSPAPAAEQSLRLEVGVASTWDDNILEFSSEQIREFDPVNQPGRFATRSIGEAIFTPSLGLGWELDEGGGRRHALRIRGTGNLHARNGTADDRTWSGRWRESFPGGRRLSIGYALLPRYYLRQLLDEDTPAGGGDARYRRAEFALHVASARWTQGAGGHRTVSVDYQYEHRGYEEPFRERTSHTHEGTARLGFRAMPRRGAVDLQGGYRTSRAVATDGDDPPGAVPDDADLSYHGISAGAGARLELARRGAVRVGADVAYRFETRAFDSDRPADRYHAGRNDRLNAVEFGLRSAASPHWSLRLFYRHEANTAHLGAAAPASSEAGSYRDNQAGLTITWAGDLWRQGQDNAPEDSEP